MQGPVASTGTSQPGTVRAYPWWSIALAAVGTVVLYIALGLLSRTTVFPEAGVSLVWLPAGLGVGLVARVPRQFLIGVIPALAAAEFIADLWLFGFPLDGTLMFVLANITEQVVIGLTLRRFKLRRLWRSSQMAALVLITLGMVLLTATLGAAASVQTFGSDYWQAWLTWYLGSVTSILLAVPVILSFHLPSEISSRRLYEGTALISTTIIVSLIVFTQPLLSGPFTLLIALFVPLLAWLGIRLGVMAVTATALAVVFIAALAAARSLGPFTGTVPDLQLLMAFQIFLVLAAATVYAAALIEQDRARARREEKLARLELEERVRTDQLTGLLNRYGLSERIEAWAADEDEGTSLTIMFCDLDSFKVLNDSAGHHAGDEVLRTVAHRLHGVKSTTDLLARPGSDEFVLLRNGTSPQEDRALADRIHQEFAERITIGRDAFTVALSIGIARLATHDRQPDAVGDLLRRADVALHSAKETDERTRLYDEEMDERLRQELLVKSVLEDALEHDRVLTVFQPVVDIETGEEVAAEALARIGTERGAVLRPDEFIPVAEASGIIIDLGRRVLDHSLEYLKSRAAIDPGFCVAVNASQRELLDPDFVQHLLSRLREEDVDPSHLTVEVTERVILDDEGRITDLLKELRGHHVNVAIDDFGTGYSSLNAIRTLPANVVKIDKLFVQGMPAQMADHAIVKAVLQVCHDLGKRVVAEGIETQAQHDMLRELGCPQGQGFLFGRPARPTAQVASQTAPAAPRPGGPRFPRPALPPKGGAPRRPVESTRTEPGHRSHGRTTAAE